MQREATQSGSLIVGRFKTTWAWLGCAILLAGCEGSTTMTHTFHNRSEDSLVLKALFDSLPWYDTATVVLPPGQMHTLYTYDMLGKCNECFGLYSPTLWIDTIEVEGRCGPLIPPQKTSIGPARLPRAAVGSGSTTRSASRTKTSNRAWRYARGT